jgi:redox-sensing transcriptional repressor
VQPSTSSSGSSRDRGRHRRHRDARRPAQEVCDRLVAAGVTSILNFAPAVLAVPRGVDVRKVDLSLELQILSFHEHRKAAPRPVAAADPVAEASA